MRYLVVLSITAILLALRLSFPKNTFVEYAGWTFCLVVLLIVGVRDSR